MELAQSLYYILADIFYILGIAVMILLVFIALKIKSSVESVKKNVTEKVNEVTSLAPTKIASMVGMGMSAYLMHRVKKIFKKK